MTLDHLAFTFSRAIVELEQAVASKRSIGALMRSKWIDGNFAGDCETLLGLFRSESTDAWERNTAAYYLAVYEDEQRRMKWRLAIEAMCRA